LPIVQCRMSALRDRGPAPQADRRPTGYRVSVILMGSVRSISFSTTTRTTLLS